MKITTLSLLLAGLFSASQLWAVPVLQVGAPASGGTCASGLYATYASSSTDPTETDTAITSGGTICVSGLFQSDDVVKLGGEYTGTDASNPSKSLDWDDFMTNGANPTALFPTEFGGKGAILVVTVEDADLVAAFANLTVGGSLAFFSDSDNSYFPNNHAPTNDADNNGYLFFDIGNFLESVPVPNFAVGTDPADKLGEIKSLLLGGLDLPALAALSWAHFDVMALETTCNNDGIATDGLNCVTAVKTTDVANNPGSHDLTWKDGGDDDTTDDDAVPEPGILFLMGAGLMGLGMTRRRKSA